MRVFLAVLALGVLALAATARADTYCVAPASGCDHTASTIQAGLEQAHAHAGDDTVQLGAGTYNLDADGDSGSDSLAYPAAGAQGRVTLRGAGPTETTITRALAVISGEAMIGGEENILQRGALDVRDLRARLPASLSGTAIHTNGTTFDDLDLEVPSEATAIRLTPSGAALTSSTIEGADSTSNPSICVAASPTSVAPSYTIADVTASGCALQMLSGVGEARVRRLRMDGKLGVEFGSGAKALVDDSAIRTTGTVAAVGAFVSGAVTTEVTVNQSTLVGTGTGAGIRASGSVSGGLVKIRAFDTIVRGFPTSLQTSGSVPGGATIVGDHDSYATAAVSQASGDPIAVTSSLDDPDPLFASASDFRLKPGSPLVDFDPTGFDLTVDSPFDLAGNVRIVGGKRDVGAYELPALPTATTQEATAVTQTGASIAAVANSGGAAAGGSATLLYGTGASYGSSLALPALPRSIDDQPVAETLTGLAAGTTYHYALQVANARGTTTSPDRTFTTAAPGSADGSGVTDEASGPDKTNERDRSAQGPALTKVTLSPHELRALPKGPTIAGRGPGSKLTITLSAPAKVTFSVLGRPKGKQVGRSVVRELDAGATRLRFSGRVSGHPLAPGKYSLRVALASGKPRTVNFQIVG